MVRHLVPPAPIGPVHPYGRPPPPERLTPDNQRRVGPPQLAPPRIPRTPRRRGRNTTTTALPDATYDLWRLIDNIATFQRASGVVTAVVTTATTAYESERRGARPPPPVARTEPREPSFGRLGLRVLVSPCNGAGRARGRREARGGWPAAGRSWWSSWRARSSSWWGPSSA